jgi:hypothetical protein
MGYRVRRWGPVGVVGDELGEVLQEVGFSADAVLGEQVSVGRFPTAGGTGPGAIHPSWR